MRVPDAIPSLTKNRKTFSNSFQRCSLVNWFDQQNKRFVCHLLTKDAVLTKLSAQNFGYPSKRSDHTWIVKISTKNLFQSLVKALTNYIGQEFIRFHSSFTHGGSTITSFQPGLERNNKFSSVQSFQGATTPFC